MLPKCHVRLFSFTVRCVDLMDGQASSSMVLAGNFDAFNSDLQENALKTTRNALALPSDVAFHRSIDADFAKDLDDFSSRVLSLTNKLLSLVGTSDTIQSSLMGKGKGKLENQDDVVDNFHSLVVDSMDQLLERTVSVFLSILFTVDDTHPGYMSGRIPGCRKSTCNCDQPPEANSVEGLSHADQTFGLVIYFHITGYEAWSCGTSHSACLSSPEATSGVQAQG